MNQLPVVEGIEIPIIPNLLIAKVVQLNELILYCGVLLFRIWISDEKLATDI